MSTFVDKRPSGGLVGASGMSRDRTITINVCEGIESDDPLYHDLRLVIGSQGLEQITLLLDCGAGVNSRDTHGRTPLMWAAIKGNVPTLRLLIERGAQINAADEKGDTALMRAASCGRTEAVTYLIESGANIMSHAGM